MTPSFTVTNKLNWAGVEKQVRAAIGVYADTSAKKLEGEAKEKASWVDRTTNARNSIRGTFGWNGSICSIILSGGVDYFVYLELAYGKRYSILVPTIEANAPAIIKGYRKVVGGR